MSIDAMCNPIGSQKIIIYEWQRSFMAQDNLIVISSHKTRYESFSYLKCFLLLILIMASKWDSIALKVHFSMVCSNNKYIKNSLKKNQEVLEWKKLINVSNYSK